MKIRVNSTLDPGIDVAPGINVTLEHLEKTINITPFLNNRWFNFFVYRQRKNEYKVKQIT